MNHWLHFAAGAQTDKKNPATQWAAKNSVKLEPFSQEEVTAKDEKVAANIWKQLQDVGITIINNFLLPEHAEKVGLFLVKYLQILGLVAVHAATSDANVFCFVFLKKSI